MQWLGNGSTSSYQDDDLTRNCKMQETQATESSCSYLRICPEANGTTNGLERFDENDHSLSEHPKISNPNIEVKIEHSDNDPMSLCHHFAIVEPVKVKTEVRDELGTDELDHIQLKKRQRMLLSRESVRTASHLRGTGSMESSPKNKQNSVAIKNIPSLKKVEVKASKVFCRSTFDSLIKLVNGIKDKITIKHLEVFDTTPFGRLFRSLYHGQITHEMSSKQARDIFQLLKNYDDDRKEFTIGGNYHMITPEDIGLIFAIPNEGETFNIDNKMKTIPREGLKKMKKGKHEIVYIAELRREVEERVVEVDEESIKEWVCLTIMYMGGTLFFASNKGKLQISVAVKMMSINEMNQISWPKVIHQHLLKNMTSNISKSISGCTIALLYWICDRFNVIQPIEHVAVDAPTATKWKLPDLHSVLTYKDLSEFRVRDLITNQHESEALDKLRDQLKEEVEKVKEKEKLEKQIIQGFESALREKENLLEKKGKIISKLNKDMKTMEHMIKAKDELIKFLKDKIEKVKEVVSSLEEQVQDRD